MSKTKKISTNNFPQDLYKSWKPKDISYYVQWNDKESRSFFIIINSPKEYENVKIKLTLQEFDDLQIENGIPVQYKVLTKGYNDVDSNIHFLIENIFGDILEQGLKSEERNNQN